jgi:hypothetical protein
VPSRVVLGLGPHGGRGHRGRAARAGEGARPGGTTQGREERRGERRGELTTVSMDGSNHSSRSTLGRERGGRGIGRLLCAGKTVGEGAHGGGRGRLGHMPRAGLGRAAGQARLIPSTQSRLLLINIIPRIEHQN